MKNNFEKPPLVFVDTSTLLTLLLGGDRHQQGAGYTELLKLMVQKGLIRLAITDMVAAEFLGLKGPVYSDDIIGASERVTAASVYAGYPFAQQRIDLLKDLLATRCFSIYSTNCGNEYLERVRALYETSPHLHNGEGADAYAANDPRSIDKLRLKLLETGGSLSKIVRNDKFTDAQGNKANSTFKDRGEVSIADAIASVQNQEGKQTKIFVLFEGNDVRGRIIQRLSTQDKQSPVYHQFENILKEYNPKLQSFHDTKATQLGDIHFVTTKAFLSSMMWVGKQMDDTKQQHTRSSFLGFGKISHSASPARKFYLVNPDEMNSPEQYEAAYHHILTHVEQNGLGRRYKRFHDKPIYCRDFDHKTEQVPTMFSEKSPEEGSWQSYIETCFATKRSAIDNVIKNFSNYRESEHQRVTECKMTECIKDMEKLNPISLKTMLDTLIPNLQQLQVEAKHRTGRGD